MKRGVNVVFGLAPRLSQAPATPSYQFLSIFKFRFLSKPQLHTDNIESSIYDHMIELQPSHDVVHRLYKQSLQLQGRRRQDQGQIQRQGDGGDGLRHVPKQLEYKALYRIAILCERYDCHAVVEP